MMNLDVARQAHAAARRQAVMQKYLQAHPGGMLQRKISDGAMNIEDGYALLKEVSADPKTGVDRADLLPLVLAYEIEGAEQHGWPLSVAVIDLDNFKQINTELQHTGADEILKEVAEILSAGTRDSDEVVGVDQSIIRWGGEEFVVVLVHADQTSAHRVAERLRQSIQHRLQGRRPAGQLITVSIGLAVWQPGEMEDWKDLLELADQRLSKAKANGKNQVVSD